MIIQKELREQGELKLQNAIMEQKESKMQKELIEHNELQNNLKFIRLNYLFKNKNLCFFIKLNHDEDCRAITMSFLVSNGQCSCAT